MSDKNDLPPPVPTPADPARRREPLPWQVPKALEDDPEALARVQTIMASAGYRQADRDLAFLDQDETRGVRLQIDYLKPELLLQAHGVERSIVVFGSTRLPEPKAATRKVTAIRQALAGNPDDEDLQRRLNVALSIQQKSRYYEEARIFGQLVGAAGRGPEDCRLTLVTGGGRGIGLATAKLLAERGARMETNYMPFRGCQYGYTGSARAGRFMRLDGGGIDLFQQPTQFMEHVFSASPW